ncbi:MAG: methyltransferase domain-containing protein [Gammaproteobacteria bacterium]|nr:methyltransferase domain-containing protein [Gammaproteobacteria bacterium]MXY55841.1 methyltransferase domain-containing protein [Gammaproteobacteria bacterium]MYF29458.1 methyltransferase domain-containing protein [Gammaproteobacteria bacterium]MYK47630.1 methyltransferase domain-containing protein [Gammaproteobacteria bacterium]
MTATLGATCFAGLGPLAQRALERQGAQNVSGFRVRNHDYLSFRLERSEIRSVRSVHLLEDVFLEISRTPSIAKSSDIAKLSRRLDRAAILQSVALKNEAFPDKKRNRRGRPTYTCFVRQNRDHRVHRKRVSQEVVSLIGRLFPRWRVDDPADLEFWVFWADYAVLALRLSDRTLKYRGRRPPELPGALRPTIAAAMVELADVQDGHAVLDPMCGTGTLLLECTRRFPRADLFGSDRSDEAVATAKGRLGGNATIRRCELDELDHAPGTFHRVVTNLPWGDQTPIQGSVYAAGVSKLLDCITDDGVAVLLTSRRELLEPTLRRLRARWKTTRVLVQGTWASIYVVTKR